MLGFTYHLSVSFSGSISASLQQLFLFPLSLLALYGPGSGILVQDLVGSPYARYSTSALVSSCHRAEREDQYDTFPNYSSLTSLISITLAHDYKTAIIILLLLMVSKICTKLHKNKQMIDCLFYFLFRRGILKKCKYAVHTTHTKILIFGCFKVQTIWRMLLIIHLFQ